MNAGAAIAKGEIFFFLHADTIPPTSCFQDIVAVYSQGYLAGSYRLSFDYDHWFLRFNCWFTKFNFTPFRFGDQGLFIDKKLFRKIRGFNSELIILEDQEIVWRIHQFTKFKIFEKSVITSARKYLFIGIFRLQVIFLVIYFLYLIGVDQDHLVRLYTRMIHDEKRDRAVASFSGIGDELQSQER